MSLSKAIGIVSGINEVGNFVQLFRSVASYLRSGWNNGGQEQQIQEHEAQEQQIHEHEVLQLQSEAQEQQTHEHEVLQLQSDLRTLSETLPSTYNLLDRAEWRSHEKYVAELLPKLNNAVYDAEDLLNEFRWYEIKASIEGNNSTQLSSLIEFFHSVIQGSFNKVTDIQKRLDNLSNQLEKMGLHKATPRFDKSLRPVTTSFPTEAKIFGRQNEIDEVVRLLGVPDYSSRPSFKRKRTCNAANSEPRAACVPVLPIVGLGGVGKTTLAQEITTLQSVKSHFGENIFWICVSDEFNAERFTKVLIKSLSGREAMADNFDDLQKHLACEVGKKRFLLILDDIWPDAVKEDGRNWRKFCAPLANALQGSMLLMTTRFEEVAKVVGTKEYFGLEYIELKGLEPEVFWDLFKLCVFGSENYQIDDLQLEQIGRSILPKLKGSPLAAVTIGKLLRKSLTTEHWNDILNCELWQLQQNETDILPALRLSYMYLPFHLKRCFSFCAVYPKGYNFQKASLAEIWAAEGFVEPQGNIPLQHIGGQYFEELVNLSFFQKLDSNYLIHDLMHDMAQLVSKDECFIIKKASDFGKVPQNVRHLSIHANCGLRNLEKISKHEKLRTLFCQKSLANSSLSPVMHRWFSELQCLRAISLDSTTELPDNISNLKHLRYLEISKSCPFKRLPSSFCCLYNLQILHARKCVFESLPTGFSNMINLQKFEAQVQAHTLNVDALILEKIVWLINNSTVKDLIIDNLGALSKDHVAELDIRKMEYLNCLTLKWSSLRSQEHNEIEVLKALHPPRNIKSIHLKGYPGEYLPWGSHPPRTFSTLISALFHGSDRPEENINQNEAPVLIVGRNNDRPGSIFSSLTELRIEASEQLSSLEQFLQPYCVPAIKKVVVENCPRISLRYLMLTDLHFLELLMVCDCPNIISQGVISPYLKKLILKESRILGGNPMTVLNLEMWSLPALLELTIIGFNSLAFPREGNLSHHGGSNNSTRALSSLTDLTIKSCSNFKNIDVFLSHEYLPSIRRICISDCAELQCLPCGRFGSNARTGSIFPSLIELSIEGCEQLSSLEQFLQPDCVPAIKKIVFENCPRLSLKYAKTADLHCLEELSVRLSKYHFARRHCPIPEEAYTERI